MTCHEAARLLDAYVDNELAAADAAPLVDHLDVCPSCRARFSDLQSLSRLVRQVPYRPAPDRLRTAVAGTRKRASKRAALFALAASVAVAVAAGGMFAGVRALRAQRTSELAASLAEAVVHDHVRALTDGPVFDVASSDQHTVKPWFQGRVDFSPPVPNLDAIGFVLVGGRVDTVEGRRTAAIVYKRRLHVVTLFVWPSTDRDVPAEARRVRGFNVRHWSADDLTYWAVSDLNDAELADFARAFPH